MDIERNNLLATRVRLMIVPPNTGRMKSGVLNGWSAKDDKFQ